MTNTDLASLGYARRLIATDGRRLRERARLSITEVGGSLGVAPTIVAKWEADQIRPRRENALAYAQLLLELAELGDGQIDHAPGWEPGATVTTSRRTVAHDSD